MTNMIGCRYRKAFIIVVICSVPLSLALVASVPSVFAAKKKPVVSLTWPPKLPAGKTIGSGTSGKLLQGTDTLREGVKIAKTAPQIDFMYYPRQTYQPTPGLWSAWGDSLAVGDKCYSSIGDHSSPGGNAFVYEYDANKKALRTVVDLRKTLKLPAGHYTPGKIHSRLDLGSDGWLYFSTHRGSTKVGLDPKNHFHGDWIMRYHPPTEKTEVIVHAPLKMQCMPTDLLDPDRLIFYAGTADGLGKSGPQFLAYDVKRRRVLYSDGFGPYRYMIFARSTGKIYFHGATSTPGRTQGPQPLVRFDPEKPGKPTPIKARCGLRSATQETPQGFVYTIDRDALWAFNTKTEKVSELGPSAVGDQTYTTSIDADMKTGRYLYYVPGAHGRSEKDGAPLIQFDVKTRTRKVIAFLHPYLYDKYGFVPCGAFGTAVSPSGDKVYITWNGNRNTPRKDLAGKIKFDTCAFVVVHIPESERRP